MSDEHHPSQQRRGGQRVVEERGAAIVFLSIVMVLLLGMAAFAVDLGWLLVNGSRLQRAADAAALHGVTYLPGFASQAQTAAEEAVTANGFPVPGTSVATSQVAAGQLEVTLGTSVDTFFLRVFGQDTVDIQRTATAEYVKPVPMGGDAAWFGNGSGSGPGASQNFWAAIQGQYTNRYHGDPYATACGTWPDRPEVSPPGMSCGSTSNATYRPDGYWLVVDVPVGHVGNVPIVIFNGGFNPGGGGPNDINLGDASGLTNAMTTTFSVHDLDLTPFDPTDNPLYAGGSCVAAMPPGTNSGDSSLCTLINPAPGLYPIHITSSNGEGSNHFTVKTSSSSPGVRVYGVNDISIWANTTGSAIIPLAEIDAVHAGKKLLLSFYDPGDASGYSTVTIVPPTGTASCTWHTEDTQTGTIGPSTTSNPCTIVTTLASGSDPRLFNGLWIRMEIDLPATYSCTVNCWWSVDFNLSGPTDRTVWEARVIGNPVHLVIGNGTG